MGTKLATALVRGEESFAVGVKAGSQARDKMGGGKVDFSFAFVSSKYDYPAVVRGIRKATDNAPLIGCSTAGEFTEEAVEKGAVACGVVSSDTHRFFGGLGTGLRENEIVALKEASAGLPSNVEGYPYLSAVVLVDGLAGKGEESILAALDALGPNVKFSGGAAADDLKFRQTYVFVDEQVATDAVGLALFASRVPVAIGVKHGHTPISPPLTVTKSQGNVVYEMDGKSAFEVWKRYTRENARGLGMDVDKMSEAEAIATFFTRYEAGLLTGTEYKIRWLGGTTTTNGPISFTCAIPEGTVLRVMESPQAAQVASARKAAEVALTACKGVKLAGAVVFDCVCRAVILGDDFARAIDGIKEVLGEIPLIGFETYGEIAMEIGQLSGFHNTTSVVLLIPD